ncbi:hypothetical protein Glove_320g127 [Diversispora epigaea]|uniref:Protein kinase domain-containing protein n=1 Tax=Diversispora epigaea TaxID=1348612 RepID=A0A397HVZ0_9GLOM|nr:hypothetical protein Glove_320g127 [Diversispora epigaea]
MSLPYSKKDLFKSALEGRFIKNFDYNAFENIIPIARGGFGTVHRADSTNLGKHVALKSLYENDGPFYENFVRELTNILAVNNHDNIINFYGISIDPLTETYYLVLQYAKDGDLRTYLHKNFKSLDWKIKINMAKDITSGLRCIHEENIVHKDLHSRNILVHEGRLLITDLGLSQLVDANSNSIAGGMGMPGYTDPNYLRDQMNYKRDKTSDIYSLGVLFWELSSGRPPFNDFPIFEIYKKVIFGEREKPINETPEDYINIYSRAWKDDPNKRPTIKNISDSLENIKLENIYNETNENRDIKLEAYINNQFQASIDIHSRDSISNGSIPSSFTTSNREFTVIYTATQVENILVIVMKNLQESSSPLSALYNDYDNGGMIFSATLMNGKRTVALKSIVATTELFFSELKQYSRASSHKNIIGFYGISQKVDVKRNEYILVLEYANGGTLRDHLKSNFEKLEWSDKLNLAQQIVKAIEHLHSNDIIHGDLHSKNILLHDNTIKISDFSISKLSTGLLTDSKNIMEYSDPIFLKRPDKFSKTKASDIYSIGILLWEISSGKIPYESKFQDKLDLITYISQGNREDPFIGTPWDYINIYQDCWNQEPGQRPNVGKVIRDLEHIDFTKIFVESIEPNTLKTPAIRSSTGTNERSQNVLNIAGGVGEAIKPFEPLIIAVNRVISNIIADYETAQYNKKICNSLMDRVIAAEVATKTLKRRQAENAKKFCNQEYYKSFIRFINIMKRIKKFMVDVSSLHGYQKLLHFGSVKDRFDSLVKEFDAIMSELHFTMAFLERIGGGIVDRNQKINLVLHEVPLLQRRLDNLDGLDNTIKVTEIKSTELGDPLTMDRRGKFPQIFKKIYKNFEVACKPIDLQHISSKEAARLHGELTIIGKLRDSPNIIRFYGLSIIENSNVMVFEWADYGSLRELYCKYDIALHGKVQIALDICRGLTFLHSCGILHHDIRCENIMMATGLVPKIAKFRHSRMSTSATFWYVTLGTYFQKIPYEKWGVVKTSEHILAGKREKLTWRKALPEKLQKDLAKIIVSAWQDDPAIRASLQNIFLNLVQLADEYCKSVKEIDSILLSDKELDLDGSLFRAVSISDEGGSDLLDMEFNINEILSLEEGIIAHKRKEYQVAWDCFVAHAELGNAIAKYWKGYYLWKGFVVEKDLKQASELYKEAADDDIADAQLRYALSFVENPLVKFDRKVFLEYITKAVENNHPTAQYDLGIVYLHGKNGIEKDEELGMKYLRLAVLNNHHKAIEVLQKLEINVYADN